MQVFKTKMALPINMEGKIAKNRYGLIFSSQFSSLSKDPDTQVNIKLLAKSIQFHHLCNGVAFTSITKKTKERKKKNAHMNE